MPSDAGREGEEVDLPQEEDGEGPQPNPGPVSDTVATVPRVDFKITPPRLTERELSSRGSNRSSLPSSTFHLRQKSLPALPESSEEPDVPFKPRRASDLPVAKMPLTGDGPDGSLPTRIRTSQMRSIPDSTTPISAASTTASRFSFFTSSAISAVSRLTSPTSPSPSPDHELLDVNVEAALFPAGAPSERDVFSPAAFKNLQATAVGLARRLQAAFRQQTGALREARAELDAEREELEEARTRAQHLKMQLAGMARRAEEHEEAMQQLMAELLAERKARAEERQLSPHRSTAAAAVASEGSTVSEDLGVDEELLKRRQWRQSACSTIRSEVGFDTDEENTECDSVFSRSRSPTISQAMAASEGVPAVELARTTSVPRTVAASMAPKPKPASQMSRLQKMFKGIGAEPSRVGEENSAGLPCRNCQGQDASVAWNTVGVLRDENRTLKQRVGELEVAVEGALDVVYGIGM